MGAQLTYENSRKELSDLSGYHDCHNNGNAFSQYKGYVELVNHRKVQ